MSPPNGFVRLDQSPIVAVAVVLLAGNSSLPFLLTRTQMQRKPRRKCSAKRFAQRHAAAAASAWYRGSKNANGDRYTNTHTHRPTTAVRVYFSPSRARSGVCWIRAWKMHAGEDLVNRSLARSRWCGCCCGRIPGPGPASCQRYKILQSHLLFTVWDYICLFIAAAAASHCHMAYGPVQQHQRVPRAKKNTHTHTQNAAFVQRNVDRARSVHPLVTTTTTAGPSATSTNARSNGAGDVGRRNITDFVSFGSQFPFSVHFLNHNPSSPPAPSAIGEKESARRAHAARQMR